MAAILYFKMTANPIDSWPQCYLSSRCSQSYGLAGYALILGVKDSIIGTTIWDRDSDVMIHNIAAMFFKVAAFLPKFDPESQPTAGIKL